VIIPAYDEEDALPATLAELRRAQPTVEIAVVDDGSADRTAGVARDAGAHVVCLPFNLGVGGAVRAGLRYAAEGRFACAVVVDADGQHDAAGVSALVGALDDGADLVVGSRFAGGSPDYPVGRTRRRAMRTLARLVRLRTGQTFTDVTSGYRGFSRPAIEVLSRQYPVEYLADTVEALLIIHDLGGHIVEVPVPMRRRAGGVPSARGFVLVVNYLRLLVGIISATIFPRSRRRAELRYLPEGSAFDRMKPERADPK
jgi:glycosyltransferase involved in cell wall biosynthesis